MIDLPHPHLSIVRQCALVSISRSAFYYAPTGETPLNLALMRLIDEQFLETPFYGPRQIARHLRCRGHVVGRKRVPRLMAKMGPTAIYQKPGTSEPHPEHRTYKDLLRHLTIDRPNQAPSRRCEHRLPGSGCADITYIPIRRGVLYLVAVMDWATRKVLAYRLSNTMDTEFCIQALEDALAQFGAPEIFNTDQGSSSPAHASPMC